LPGDFNPEDAGPMSEPSNEAEPSTGDDRNHAPAPPPAPPEIGGRDGPDPTRYGDWELKGRCIDF
jgi:hypothetical protein